MTTFLEFLLPSRGDERAPFGFGFPQELFGAFFSHKTLWNKVLRFARSAGRLSTYSRANVQKSRLACMDGLFFSPFSPPAEQDGPGAAVWFDVGGTMRGGRAGLRNKSADYRRRDGRATLGARSLLMQPA